MSKILDQRVFDKENMFGKGQENSGLSEYFTGKSYVNPLTKPGESTVALANVTFARATVLSPGSGKCNI